MSPNVKTKLFTMHIVSFYGDSPNAFIDRRELCSRLMQPQADTLKGEAEAEQAEKIILDRKKRKKAMRKTTAICLTVAALVFIPAASFAQICAQPPQGIIGWWNAEGNARDIVGANNGSLENGATFGTGMVGQAFQFDGINDFVKV